ncbi:hypothetical protein D7X74_34520 [Corallococcus sp. CA047B]|nr:hypothetical protein D7X74_34520 [Corallococcus sp. CA047B]
MLSTAGLLPAGAADKSQPTELSLKTGEVQVYGWHNGSLEVFIVDKEAALHVFLPDAKGCQPEYRGSVGESTTVELYRGKDVRTVVPWGAVHPPLPATHSLEKASAGVIECTASKGADGKPGVRITLKNLTFTRHHISKMGPVEAPLGVRPP